MTSPQPVRVIIIDDHPIVRRGMVQLVNDAPSIEVIAEANSAFEALEILETEVVDVVVTDFDMPKMNGLELTKKLQQCSPSFPVVLLTMHENEQLFNEAINAGVSSYLLKDEAIDGIVEGILAAAKGDSYVSPSLSKFIMRRASKSFNFQKTNSGIESLTPTERKVLKHVSQNLSSHETADSMGVSYRTITTHRNNISTKLGLSGKHPLLNFALEHRSAIMSLDS